MLKGKNGRLVDQADLKSKTKKNEDHDLERGDLLNSDIPEWLQEFRVPERRDSHASSSNEPFLEPTRSADLGKHSVFHHFRSARGPKSQGHHAEDALAEPYFVQKILVI